MNDGTARNLRDAAAARALDGFNTGDCYEVEIEDYETLTAALENLRSDNDGK